MRGIVSVCILLFHALTCLVRVFYGMIRNEWMRYNESYIPFYSKGYSFFVCSMASAECIFAEDLN
jgi:hypothetical protein